ncbi:MAG: NAD-dependent epimerase/dehydratase family protein [Anaerolineales bacterium]|jgi:dihydroflavonol-4-reductase
MNILVTGATGFIGSQLCRALVRDGHRVSAFVRATSDRSIVQDLSLRYAVGDLMQPKTLYSAMRGMEVIYHCGGMVARWSDPQAMITSHIQGTRHVLDAALASGVRRLIYTSSVAALGVPPLKPSPGDEIPLLDETHAWNYDPSIWPYGYGKHMAEQELLSSLGQDLQIIILNPAAVFGPGDIHRVETGIVTRLSRRGLPVTLPGGVNVVHIEDVVEGHLAALHAGQSGERYILGGHNITLREMMATITTAAGTSPPRLTIPLAFVRPAARLVLWMRRAEALHLRTEMLHLAGYYFYYDTSKAEQSLGLKPPRSFSSAIDSYLNWLKSVEPA